MKITYFLVLLCFIYSVKAQDNSHNTPYKNFASPNIKTMRAYVKGNELSYPVIQLNGQDQLVFEFDEIADEANNFSYQIIHCNSNWKRSDLFSDEFMDGFNENPIYDYAFSSNTTVYYVHYKVELPNDEVNLKVSGNYVLRVIENDNRDSTVAMMRFSIYEPVVNIMAEITRPLGAQLKDQGQEVKLTIGHRQLQVDDPFSEVKVIINQNGRPNREVKNIKPVFVRNNELVYSFSGENILMAGNEFRTFDFHNMKQWGLNVDRIAYADTIHHVFLRPDERRSYKRYFWEQEMNGKYVINVADGYDFYKMADYAYVHFTLPFPEPFLDGKVYIYGALTNWKCTPDNVMTYNFEKQIYQGGLLVKQGYHDYIYVKKTTYNGNINETLIEGSHYQTENDYLIYVYYHSFDMRYDRLVGYQVINSKYSN